jgi:NAD(P)-dependent dehydrogenase (short-subunit alcohol dehydrogenase family)
MASEQKPIGSGVNAYSTAEEVIAGIDLTGRMAVVTGGYDGLGLETARVLRLAGAQVIVPARNLAKAKANLAHVPGVEIWEMDLLDPASIDAFAGRFLKLGRPLDVLVNSAGIMGLPQLTLDNRGYEFHFATNHLGHFQLTHALLPALREAGKARVVSVSAWAHRHSPIHFDDLFFQNHAYVPILGYAQSKTANILFAVELDRREKANGIRAYSLHPGSIITNLGQNWSQEQLRAFGVIDAQGNPIIDPSRAMKTIPQGAATQVWCATNPRLADIGGVYCENVDVAGIVPPEERTNFGPDDSTRKVGVMPHAIDPVAAGRLWEVSDKLIARRI